MKRYFSLLILSISFLFFVSCPKGEDTVTPPVIPPAIELSISSIGWNSDDTTKVDNSSFTIQLNNDYVFIDDISDLDITTWFTKDGTAPNAKSLALKASNNSESKKKLDVSVTKDPDTSLLGQYSITIPTEYLNITKENEGSEENEDQSSENENPSEPLTIENIIEFKLGIASLISITPKENEDKVFHNLSLEFEGVKCLSPFKGSKNPITTKRKAKGSSSSKTIGPETVEIKSNESLLFIYASSSFNDNDFKSFADGDEIEMEIYPINPKDPSEQIPTRFEAIDNYKLPDDKTFSKTVTLSISESE